MGDAFARAERLTDELGRLGAHFQGEREAARERIREVLTTAVTLRVLSSEGGALLAKVGGSPDGPLVERPPGRAEVPATAPATAPKTAAATAPETVPETVPETPPEAAREANREAIWTALAELLVPGALVAVYDVESAREAVYLPYTVFRLRGEARRLGVELVSDVALSLLLQQRLADWSTNGAPAHLDEELEAPFLARSASLVAEAVALQVVLDALPAAGNFC